MKSDNDSINSLVREENEESSGWLVAGGLFGVVVLIFCIDVIFVSVNDIGVLEEFLEVQVLWFIFSLNKFWVKYYVK